LADEARLADPSVSHDGDDVGLALPLDAAVGRMQKLELALTADERAPKGQPAWPRQRERV
jgi:hypothetical protein